MQINLHCRNFDENVKDAIIGMTAYGLAKLLPGRERLLNNVEVDINMRRHHTGGEAKIKDGTNVYRPRKFQIILDHRKMNDDEYGRRRGDDEWVHQILETLAHELVHIKQYLVGELTWRSGSLYWKNEDFSPEHLIDYHELPYEIEAHGRQRGLFLGFIATWYDFIERLESKTE
ncbi:MAG: hypothetical protein HN464_02875 [Candidatus Marinimicrobia bacterium]|jgi:hypothetical protein|nr:hypothetical protein [Candidatus Neomarinimicrobiota bacterium]